MTEEPQVRRRNSAASREALLDAAVALFAERGYDRTTVRDIAGRAGVNQALLFRYFGSKEAMFAAVIARTGRDVLADSPPAELFSRILRGVLSKDPSTPNLSLQIMLRSNGEDTGAKAIRQELSDEYTRVFAGLTDEPDADLRAHLVLAWIVGIDLVRSVSATTPLADSDPEQVVASVLPAVRMLLQRTTDISDEE